MRILGSERVWIVPYKEEASVGFNPMNAFDKKNIGFKRVMGEDNVPFSECCLVHRSEPHEFIVR